MKKKLNLINDEFVIEDSVLVEYNGNSEEVVIPNLFSKTINRPL